MKDRSHSVFSPGNTPLPSPKTPPLIRLENISVGYGDALVFSDLSYSFHAGEHLALLGPNGSGKSTLFRLIQGELRPPQQTPGSIVFGFEGKEERSFLAPREHVRLVSPAQQRNYVRQGWKISGEEILLSGLANAAMLYGELSSRYYEKAAALAETAGASHLLGMYAPAMSQGQLRMCLILRALMSDPALLLLDEPYDGLDGPARERVSRCMALASERGSTLLLSAHRREDIPPFIVEALLLDKGRLSRISLRDSPRLLVPEISSETVPFETSAENTTDSQTAYASAHAPVETSAENTTDSQTAYASAHAPDTPFVQAILAKSSPLLELSHVDVFIERKQVLSDISWTVLPGEQWIVSGRNGSGKSTLLRLLYGEEFAAYGGSVLWCGGPRPGLDELHSGVGYVSDRLQDAYDYDLSAEDVVISGLRGHIGLYHEAEEEERSLARSWLKRLGLAHVTATLFHSLSSGTARRVLLARALASSPPVLLLDEPCSGLDTNSRSLFLNALPALAAQGVTLIYVSHHEQDKTDLFTHELRLENGKVVFAGKRAE